MGCALLTIGSGVIAIVLVQVVYITFASRDLNGASGPAQPFHAGTAPPPGVIWIWPNLLHPTLRLVHKFRLFSPSQRSVARRTG